MNYKAKKPGGSRRYYVECNGDCWTATRKHSTPEGAAKEWNNLQPSRKAEILNSDRLRNLSDEDLAAALSELQNWGAGLDPEYWLDWLRSTDWGLDVDA